MRNLDLEQLRKIVDHLYGMAEHVFLKTDGYDPTVYGVELKADGAIAGLHHYAVDDPTQVSRVVAKMQKKFPVVVNIAEVWVAPDTRWPASAHPERKEQLGFMVYANGTAYAMGATIERYPTRVSKGTLEPVGAVLGRMAPEGPVDAGNLSAFLSEVLANLRARPEDWRSKFDRDLLRVFNQPAFAELAKAVCAVDLPPDSAGYALQQIEKLSCFVPSLDMGPMRERTVGWLAGIRIRVHGVKDGRLIDATETYRAMADIVPDVPNRPPNMSVFWAPHHHFVTQGDFLPVSMAAALSAEAARWVTERPIGSVELIQWLEDFNDRAIHAFAERPLNEADQSFCLIVVVADRPGQAMHGLVDPARLTWEPGVDLGLPLFTESLAKVSELFSAQMTIEEIAPLHQALRNKHLYEREVHLRQIVRMARELAVERGAQSTALRVEMTVAKIAKPIPHETVYLTVWSGDGLLLMPANFQRMAADFYPTVLHDTAALLRQLGVEEVVCYDGVLEADRVHLDDFGMKMMPDFKGGWFAPSEVIYPEARDVLQRLKWDFVDEAAARDPAVRDIPLPHRLLRSGLVETTQRRYKPHVYRAIRESLGDQTIADEDVWERVCDEIPAFRGLYDNPNRRGFAIPDPLVFNSLRFSWGKSPTLVIRTTLIDRLLFTDIKPDLPVAMVHAPYPLAYIHFQRRLGEVSLRVKDETGDKGEHVYRLEGAFVRELVMEDVRRLTITLIYREGEEAVNIAAPTVMDIADETVPLAEYIGRYQQRIGLGEGEAAAELEALMEVAKVLIYVGLPDARKVESPDRSRFLHGLQQKKAHQQLQLLHKARGRFDHILIGPERPLDDATEVLGASGRHMPVHVRRGHMHVYRIGKGRLQTVIRFLQPIVVRKDLLAGGQPPPPKDYDVQ